MPSSLSSLLTTAFDFYAKGEGAEAERLCQEVLAQEPQHPRALHMLGVLLYDRKAYADAYDHLQSALDQDGGDAERWAHWGRAALALGQSTEARKALETALTRWPTEGGLWSVVASARRADGDKEAALEAFEQARAHGAADKATRLNWGNLLCDLGRAQEAEPLLLKVIEQAPEEANAWNNLSFCLYEQGRPEDSLFAAERALALAPEDPEAALNRAHALLCLGRWEDGFPAYEARQAARSGLQRGGRRWDGQALSDGALLLTAEQGLGDALQFLRFAKQAKERGVTTVVELPRPLLSLITQAPGCDAVIAPGDEPPYPIAATCPLMSLPGVLGLTSPEALPPFEPFIKPEEPRATQWAEKIEGHRGLTVGLAWSGNPGHPRDHLRSLPPDLLPLLRCGPSVRFVSLQKGTEAPAFVQSFETLDQDGPFLDTAALIQSLDLVIAVDSAVAHLAGSMGRPCWLLLSHAPDWRWMQKSEATPWYPSLRLFRQENPGDWLGTLSRVREQLRLANRESLV